MPRHYHGRPLMVSARAPAALADPLAFSAGALALSAITPAHRLALALVGSGALRARLVAAVRYETQSRRAATQRRRMNGHRMRTPGFVGCVLGVRRAARVSSRGRAGCGTRGAQMIDVVNRGHDVVNRGHDDDIYVDDHHTHSCLKARRWRIAATQTVVGRVCFHIFITTLAHVLVRARTCALTAVGLDYRPRMTREPVCISKLTHIVARLS